MALLHEVQSVGLNRYEYEPAGIEYANKRSIGLCNLNNDDPLMTSGDFWLWMFCNVMERLLVSGFLLTRITDSDFCSPLDIQMESTSLL